MKSMVVLLVCCFLLDLARADDHEPCYDNEDLCVQNMRKLMENNTTFWFGDAYLKTCPPFSFSADCNNPNTASKNILSRLYNVSSTDNFKAVIDRLELAHITYDTPAGSYVGCGKRFDVPAVKDFALDPMSVVTASSWSTDHLPNIEWTHAGHDVNEPLYTVLFWDVGYFYLHGLYINARSGDIKNADIIDKYHGPLNPSIRPNVFLFAVFRQDGPIDPASTTTITKNIIDANRLAFIPSTFFSMVGMFGGPSLDLVAANVMSKGGDAYSIQQMKDNVILNHCPYLITQSQVFKDALKGANIMAQYTPIIQTLDYQTVPHLSTLTADLQVMYQTPSDIYVDSCCVNTLIPKSNKNVHPLNNDVFGAALTSNAPGVKISPIKIFADQYDSVKDKVYTLLMVDFTAHDNAASPTLIIQWMVNNIKNGDVTTGDQIVDYLAPNPVNRQKRDTFIFLLLEQPTTAYLDASNYKDFTSNNCPPLKQRCGYRISDMMNAWGLTKIVGVSWFQSVQDAYARKRIYSDLNLMKMIDVCDGNPGFEDPCPDMQYPGGANGATRRDVGRYTGLLATLVAFYIGCLNTF